MSIEQENTPPSTATAPTPNPKFTCYDLTDFPEKGVNEWCAVLLEGGERDCSTSTPFQRTLIIAAA